MLRQGSGQVGCSQEKSLEKLCVDWPHLPVVIADTCVNNTVDPVRLQTLCKPKSIGGMLMCSCLAVWDLWWCLCITLWMLRVLDMSGFWHSIHVACCYLCVCWFTPLWFMQLPVYEVDVLFTPTGPQDVPPVTCCVTSSPSGCFSVDKFHIVY